MSSADLSLVDAIERSLKDNRDRLAIEHDGSLRTYEELDELATMLSRQLVDRVGAGPQVIAVEALQTREKS